MTAEDRHVTEGFEIFTKSNFILLVWFLAIYIVLYLIIRLFVPLEGGMTFASRVLDIAILGLFAAYLFHFFFYRPIEYQESAIVWAWNSTELYMNDIFTVFYTFTCIFVLYVILYVTGTPMTYESKPLTVMLLETMLWLVLFTVVLVQFSHQVLNVRFTDIIRTVFMKEQVPVYGNVEVDGANTGNVIVDVSNNGNVRIDEVFNISNNLYTYSDAKAVCKSFGARLATYEDMERAYEKGAEWCNYGWSEDQMAFFPTQKSTWSELQKDAKRKDRCGRPGVNGGYMANPYVRFGVNCYGKKPEPSVAEKARMDAVKQLSVPEPSAEEKDELAKIAFWQKHRDQLLQVNAFNKDAWNEKSTV